jgi:predicted DNA-binding transcriptional regulator AlpA
MLASVAHGVDLPPAEDRLVCTKDVLAFLCISGTGLWKTIQAGGFPPGKKISRRRVGWLASDVVSWARRQPDQVLKAQRLAAAEKAPPRKRAKRFVPA